MSFRRQYSRFLVVVLVNVAILWQIMFWSSIADVFQFPFSAEGPSFAGLVRIVKSESLSFSDDDRYPLLRFFSPRPPRIARRGEKESAGKRVLDPLCDEVQDLDPPIAH